jgi:itaconyl-CoA hydratase
MSLADMRAYRQIGDRRFREVHGLYYDDVVVGEIVEHRPGRTVTETDNLWGSLLALNPNPLHIDAAYAATTEWGRPLVSSLVTLSIVTGMSVNSTSFRTIANLGWDEVRLLAPVFAGDTLYAESEFLEKRLSRSRPGQGLVTCATRGFKADGTLFLTFKRNFLLPTREGAGEEGEAPY